MSRIAAAALIKMESDEAPELLRILDLLRQQLSTCVPVNARKRHEAENLLREAYDLHTQDHAFELVYQPERAHEEERTETAVVPQGYGSYEAYGVEQRYTWNERVLEEPEKVIIRKRRV